jgi:hypothetical protein
VPSGLKRTRAFVLKTSARRCCSGSRLHRPSIVGYRRQARRSHCIAAPWHPDSGRRTKKTMRAFLPSIRSDATTVTARSRCAYTCNAPLALASDTGRHHPWQCPRLGNHPPQVREPQDRLAQRDMSLDVPRRRLQRLRPSAASSNNHVGEPPMTHRMRS